MKSVRKLLAITMALALIAGVTWAKDHSDHHGKKDSTAVCQKAACDSMDMAKCTDARIKGCCKKDSTAVCHQAKRDSTCAKECKHARKTEACKGDRKKCDASMEQTTCPVMGGAINKDIFVEHNGKKVYFCCEECKAKYLKDPDKYPLKK
jgi:YHS domain-containing protein